MQYVYGLFTEDTGRLFYVGITDDKNLYFRTKAHKNCTDQGNGHKNNTIKKHGMELRVLFEAESRKEVEEREEFLIRFLDGKLTNILSSAKDVSRARKRIRKGVKRRPMTEEERIADRDRNLTYPYEYIMELIAEWARYPQETQQSFADRHGIKRSKFKDWLRLYKPEYVGLQKRLKLYKVAHVRRFKEKVD